MRLPWKNRVALKIFTVLNILFTFRIFNNSRLPWKQSFPEIFHCIEYTFYHFGFLSSLRLPWKTEGALKFFSVLKYFLSFRIFEQLAFARKFLKPGGAAVPPDPPTSYAYVVNDCILKRLSLWYNFSDHALHWFTLILISLFRKKWTSSWQKDSTNIFTIVQKINSNFFPISKPQKISHWPKPGVHNLWSSIESYAAVHMKSKYKVRWPCVKTVCLLYWGA